MLSSYWGFLDQYGRNNQGGARRQRAGAMHHSTIYKGPHPSANITASATASMLLDPHHQPPPGAYNRRPHIFPQPATSLVEEDEYISRSQTRQQFRSDLGEPFMSGGLQSVADNGEEDSAEPPVAAGVLGLLNHFQRVQSGGRGGVNI